MNENMDNVVVNEHIPEYSESDQTIQQDQQEEITQSLDDMVPDWLKNIVADDLSVNQDKMTFVLIAAGTIVLMYFISVFISATSSSGPLQRKIEEMEKQLAGTMKELLQLEGEMSSSKLNSVDINENNPELRENEVKLQEARQELQNVQEMIKNEESKSALYLRDAEHFKQELQTAKEDTRQAEEMMEEMVTEQKNSKGNSNEDLLGVIKQLQTQFEQQKAMLEKYEPKLKKKDKDNKELTMTMRKLRADAANAQLEADKLKKELENVVKQKEEASSKYEDLAKNDDEWKSLANLLQRQLDEKNEEEVMIEDQTKDLQGRLHDIKKKLETQDNLIEVNEEIISQLRKKQLVVEEKDGWEVDGDGWNEMGEDEAGLDELKSKSEKYLEEKQALEKEIDEAKVKLASAEEEMKKHKDDSAELREARDKVVKDYSEAQKKLEVLTEFFNKKEAELQKQIGLQSAKFGDVNLDAEKTTSRLEIVNNELKEAKDLFQSLKKDLEEQERNLKLNVGDQEKKAHECWVAARQAERKVTELQSETSVLKSRLTIAENKNINLEKEKGELEGTIKSIKSSVKSESGFKTKFVRFAPDTATESDSD